MRKHRHRAYFHKNRPWPAGADGKDMPRPAPRRQHGILAYCAGPGPLTVASAKKRAHVYMHSAARRRAAQ